MGALDFVIFVGFVATVIFVGLWKSKGEKTHGEQGAQDYFLAGRGLTWWLIGFSLIAANISTEQFVGMSGKAADWLGSAVRQRDASTRATREDEIDARAFILARLGYPKKYATARLRANLEWEYEGLGAPVISKRVTALINAAYQRAGKGGTKRGAKNAG